MAARSMRGLMRRGRQAARVLIGGEPARWPAPRWPSGPRSKPRIDPLPDSIAFPQGRYLFLIGAIPARFGGRTASVLQKTRLLKELAGIESTIVTFNYAPHLDRLRADLRERGLLVDGVRLVNLHEQWVDTSTYEGPDIEHPIEEPGLAWAKNADQDIYRYFDDQGIYRLYKQWDDGRLRFRDHFNENRARTRRDEFYDNGTLRRVTFFDLHYNVPRQEVYYRRDGSPYLNIWYVVDPKSTYHIVQRATLFDEQGRPGRVYTSRDELFHSFLDDVIGDEHAFVCVESRRADGETFGYERPNVKRLYLLHNPHLLPPYASLTRIRPSYKPLLDAHADVDATVFLTVAQRADAEAVYGEQPNFYVVPHPADAAPSAPFSERDPNRVVMLARLDQQKQLNHAIDAFATVVKTLPNARLEIYGHGTERAALRNQIRRLQLTDNVKLMGYTKDPAGVYRTAALSLCTSRFEGFGLVLLESLTQGCPVVSYDIKYGPSDIVTDGVDGFLIKGGNRKLLAEKIIELLSDQDLRRRLSDAAPNAVQRFSRETYMRRWGRVYSELDAAGWRE